jgi:hypothetical protein
MKLLIIYFLVLVRGFRLKSFCGESIEEDVDDYLFPDFLQPHSSGSHFVDVLDHLFIGFRLHSHRRISYYFPTISNDIFAMENGTTKASMK